MHVREGAINYGGGKAKDSVVVADVLLGKNLHRPGSLFGITVTISNSLPSLRSNHGRVSHQQF